MRGKSRSVQKFSAKIIINNNYESKMRTKLYLFLILFVCYTFCACAKLRKVDISDNKTDARGFGSIFSLGKVLNFFPVGGERECSPVGFNIAKSGICLNPYDCRQRDGKASGDCAHGLGVCCVFEVTCGGLVQNNITYFMSPGFPELWTGERNCSLMIDRTHAGITQLRIDFVHFTIGQPNRLTGECDEDTMVLGEGANNFTLCGQNHGQHIYYTLPTGNETREEGELPRSRSTPLVITMRGSEMPRLWLMRITQMPLAYSSPHNCLQYYTKDNGTIKTFNYASNGRHLAGQEYRTCVRKNAGMCSIKYMPCDRRSFRVGTRDGSPLSTYGVPVPSYGPPAASTPATTVPLSAVVQNDMTPMNVSEPTPPAIPPSVENDEEGSGQDPQIIDSSRPAANQTQTPGIMSRIWSFILPSWMWEQRSFGRWSPYMQHLDEDILKYYGYGTYGVSGFGRQRCTDRISIPCESEYFVYGQGLGVCDPYHCGNNFCPGQRFEDCNVQTSIIPFAVSVYFGPPVEKQNPEENIGMCLQYVQIPCNE